MIKHGIFESDRVVYVPVDSILPNPEQPRKFFNLDDLYQLSQSIKTFGVIQPLTIRQSGVSYLLVAGERRLRAAKMAGLSEVPCIFVEADDSSSSMIALVENLQRRDLDFLEEAYAISRLIKVFGLSQEEAARKISMSQSAVANKLRLLRHPPEIMGLIREFCLTERHARALLRIEDIKDREAAACYIGKNGLNVSDSEKYIESVIKKKDDKGSKVKRLYIIKDVRLFINTVTRGIALMKQAGVNVNYDREENDACTTLVIKIPRKI